MSREDLTMELGLSSPIRIKQWELGNERPRPRFVPRLAVALRIDPLHLLDVDPDDPPLAALRIAAGVATDQMGAPGMSVMTYQRLEGGRPGADPPDNVIRSIADALGVERTRIGVAIRRSRGDRNAQTDYGE